MTAEIDRTGALAGPQPLRTRYAPSPTGYLHLGHVAHIVFLWGIAESLGAEVLLRVEDHDRGRCRPDYEQAILEDLDWLGYRPTNIAALDRPSPYRQSDSGEAYEQALARLRSRARVYPCICTRKQIAARCLLEEDGERRYDGFCRDRNLAAGSAHTIRVEIEAGVEEFHDGLLGPQAQEPARQCGDLLLRDRRGEWSYQFAVTVDDLRHEVNLVVRGADLLASTGRQIRLARLLGRETPPAYFHHPLILDEAGEKLSKRNSSGPIREMRRAGRTAADVVGEAAFRLGLIERARPAEREELRAAIAALPRFPL